MTLADTHVKNLLKEGTTRAGSPASGSEWRIAPDAVARAKELAEEYLRSLGETSAHACAAAKRSTLKAEDVQEPRAQTPSEPNEGDGIGLV